MIYKLGILGTFNLQYTAVLDWGALSFTQFLEQSDAM